MAKPKPLMWFADGSGRMAAYLQCFCCKKWKRLEGGNFSKSSTTFHGFKGTCKPCLKTKRKPEWSQSYSSSPKGKAVAAKANQRYALTLAGKAARKRAYDRWLLKSVKEEKR